MRALAALAALAITLGASAAASADCRKKTGAYVGAECHAFGERTTASLGSGWGGELPAFSFVLGLRTMSLDLGRGGNVDGNVESSPLAYHTDTSALGSGVTRFFGFETAILYAPVPFLYFGPLVAAGAGATPSGTFVANGLTISPRGAVGGFQFLYGGVLGARLPLGHVAVRGELMAGGQSTTFSQYASDGVHQLTATASLSRPYVGHAQHSTCGSRRSRR